MIQWYTGSRRNRLSLGTCYWKCCREALGSLVQLLCLLLDDRLLLLKAQPGLQHLMSLSLYIRSLLKQDITHIEHCSNEKHDAGLHPAASQTSHVHKVYQA